MSETLTQVAETTTKRMGPKKVAKILAGNTSLSNYSNSRSFSDILRGFYERVMGLDKDPVYASKKILTFLTKSIQQDKDRHKVEMAFREEELYESEKRHKDIINIFIKATQKQRNAQKKIKKVAKKEERKQERTKKEATPTVPDIPTPPTPTPKPTTPAPTPKAEVPKAKAEAPKATRVPKKTKKPATELPKTTEVAKTATKAAVGAGLAGAATISIAGETGAYNLNDAKKKAGQVVDNDPKPGVSSYGVFGINSGGSVQTFVRDNPQFNLVGKPGSKEFAESWKLAASTKTDEFFNAQMKWYEKYIYNPLKNDLAKMLPSNLASDARVIAYMSDRRNQMGGVAEQSALLSAKDAKTAEEFIEKIYAHDVNEENIRKMFPTYLATHGDKNIPGLKNRVIKRRKMALEVPNVIGDQINQGSVENKDMKRNMKGGQSAPVVVNNVNNNTTERNVMVKPTTEPHPILD